MTDARDLILAALRQELQEAKDETIYIKRSVAVVTHLVDPHHQQQADTMRWQELEAGLQQQCVFRVDAAEDAQAAADAMLARVQAENEQFKDALEQIRDMFEMSTVEYRTMYQDRLTIHGYQDWHDLAVAALVPQPHTAGRLTLNLHPHTHVHPRIPTHTQPHAHPVRR